MAREFDVLADLDTGGAIPNVYVGWFRGRQRLRKRATDLEKDQGGG